LKDVSVVPSAFRRVMPVLGVESLPWDRKPPTSTFPSGCTAMQATEPEETGGANVVSSEPSAFRRAMPFRVTLL
jgi:hypothetical protein